VHEAIQTFDWLIIGCYLIGLILFGAWLSRGQHNRDDYYVGGRNIGALSIGISTMATQCSTNSILGAPAFVAFAAGGGLIWLQYELAVPLAMIAIMVFMLPMFRKLELISVYEYLEHRFGIGTRLTLSALFQFVRAFATAVTVYSIALVVELITGLSFFWSVMLLGVITVIYDAFGGVRGVIYSDVLQMLVLVLLLLILLGLMLFELGGISGLLAALPAERQQTLNFAAHGFGDGETFAFWPMLLGGFFLYVSYYGCDQSQVQRELCAQNVDDANRSLLFNGFMRFPLVLLYCLVGVGVAAYAVANPEFVQSLPLNGDEPNYNLAVPHYMLEHLPVGLVGLSLVALFAAAMSSLDSVINSLSATTMEDFVYRFYRGAWSKRKELYLSRLLTVLWGGVTLWLAFHVDDIASTVLESINKIGSLVNGPVAAVFALGLLTRRTSGAGAVAGLLAGFLLNLCFWKFLPQVSWLWWNPLGFFATFGVGIAVSRFVPRVQSLITGLCWTRAEYRNFGFRLNWMPRYLLLLLWFVVMVAVLYLLQGV